VCEGPTSGESAPGGSEAFGTIAPPGIGEYPLEYEGAGGGDVFAGAALADGAEAAEDAETDTDAEVDEAVPAPSVFSSGFATASTAPSSTAKNTSNAGIPVFSARALIATPAR